jgi:ring-1,2-phenylacetyl-CoA epoxidase subunit PaaD
VKMSEDHEKLAASVLKRVRKVMDPELPFLTIEEMGMLRDVIIEDEHCVVIITPTYSGCPATDVISEDCLLAARVIDPRAEVRIAMSPAWTTDWITDETRVKMTTHGIAPPVGQSHRGGKAPMGQSSHEGKAPMGQSPHGAKPP